MRLWFACSLLVLSSCARSGAPTPSLEPQPAAVETISYAAGSEQASAKVYRPSIQGPFAALVLIHGDFGLTEGVKEQAKHLAELGYLVLAVDLYHGQVVTDFMDAHILDRGLPEEQVWTNLKGAVDYLVSRSDVRPDKLGIIGFDMGGGYALDAAIRDARLRAVITCYGRLNTDARLLQSLHASVLGIFAGKDVGISADTREQFQTAMRKAGKRLAGLHVYPECEHGFMVPAPAEVPQAATRAAVADAWHKIEAYLAGELNP